MGNCLKPASHLSFRRTPSAAAKLAAGWRGTMRQPCHEQLSTNEWSAHASDGAADRLPQATKCRALYRQSRLYRRSNRASADGALLMGQHLAASPEAALRQLSSCRTPINSACSKGHHQAARCVRAVSCAARIPTQSSSLSCSLASPSRKHPRHRQASARTARAAEGLP